MKRLLKKTLKKQFGSVASQRHSAVSMKGWFQQQVSQKAVVAASALTATTLSLITGRPAEALQIFPVDLSGYTANSFNEIIELTDDFGNTADVNFVWSGDTGNLSLGPSSGLTGGFVSGLSAQTVLSIQQDAALETESVSLDISFGAGGGAAIEQARLVVIDVDRDNDNTWQDLIQIGGSVAPAVIPASSDVVQPLLQVSPESTARVTGVPLGITQANGGTAPGTTAPDNYTVDIVGTEFVGVYNPRALDARLTGAATRTEITPVSANPNDTDVNPNDGLPNPADPPAGGVEAQNQSSEGSITADYLGAAATPLTSLSLLYGNGPASVTAAINPAGGAGFISTNDTNGGPGFHGVGLYTIFIIPGSIGTAKSVSAGPTQVSATEFDVTYTVRVQNYGTSTDLSDVQVTDDLTQTFGGTTGFTVVPNSLTVVTQPASTTLTPNTVGFDGNADQNLLDGTGSLLPGESALIQYTVRLDTTAANITPGTTYNNTVVAAGTTPIGLRITDNSVDDTANNPTNPDPDNEIPDGDPIEQSPTPVTLPPLVPVTEPNINVAEEVFDVEQNPTTGAPASFPGNTARVSYRVRVQNTGDERLTNVTLTNDFTATYDDGTRGDLIEDTGFQIISAVRSDGTETEGPVIANGAYNGGDSADGAGNPLTDDATLATGGILNPGEFTEYVIVVDVDTTDNGATLTAALPGPFNNFTTATGLGTDLTTPSNITVTDISNDIAGFGSLEAALNPVTNPADPVADPLDGGSSTDPANPPIPGSPENIPTPVTIPVIAPEPRINVSEQVVSTVLEPTGTFNENTGRVTYRIRVQNTGDEDLQNVVLTNDFTNTFDDGTRGGSPEDTGFEIVEVRQLTAGGQTPNAFNPVYDGGDSFENGSGPTNAPDGSGFTLLSGGSLAVGEFSEYEIDVDVDLTESGETLIAALPGPFNNFTTTQGDGVTSGVTVRDISNDATPFNNDLATALNPPGGSDTGGATTDPDPEPVSSTDPAAENVPTPVNLALPVINVSEEVVSTDLNPADTPTFGANTGRVVYRIRVQNTGFENLRDVTLINDFTETFDDGTRGGSGPDNGFEILSVTELDGGGQTLNGFNAAYDGGDSFENNTGPTNAPDGSGFTLLSGGSLDVGEFSEYEIVVDVDLTDSGETLIAPLPGPFNNSTLATGIGDDPVAPSNIPVADRSNDRNSVDPLPADLEGALNPDGGSLLGGSASGDPGVDPATLDPGTTDPENVPTPVSFPITQPQINVAEQVVTTVLDPTGIYGANTGVVTYRIRVQNTGVEDLNNVTLTNDFTDTFDNGTRGGSGPDNGFEILSVTELDGGGQTLNGFNAVYDGGDTVENGPAGPTNAPDGSGFTLLSGGTLAVGEFSEYEIQVAVDLTDNGETLTTALPGPFNNFTTATGIGVTSIIPVSDISNDLNSVSPTPDSLEDALIVESAPTGGSTLGNPNEPAAPAPDPADPDNTPTPANFATTPEISVIEQIDQSRTQVGDIPGSTYGASNVRLVYQIVVRNIGIENLQNVDLVNDFRPTFGVSGPGATDDFTIIGPPTFAPGSGGVETVDINPNFDGSTDLLLAGNSADPTNTLNVGEFAVYEIVVDVNTAGNTVASQLPGPFNNQTTTTGIGAISQVLTDDLSNDINPFPGGGATPDPAASDPNGNLEANEPDENIPTPALLGADLSLVKRITRVTRGGTDLLVAGINDFTNQPGTSDDDTLASLSGNTLPLGVFDVPNSLQSGDVVEYTVYFFNAGVAQAANIEMCDELQVPSVLQPASLELASPTALSTLGTSLTFAGGSPLLFPQAPLATLVESCVSFPGTFPSGTPTGGLGVGAGGGVIAGGPTLGLNVDAGEVGAFRFTVIIP